MEVLQERLLGVLGSLVCATLFPPGGVESLRMFCCAYVEPPSPSSAKRGAAWVGEGDAVEGETALSAAELLARARASGLRRACSSPWPIGCVLCCRAAVATKSLTAAMRGSWRCSGRCWPGCWPPASG